MITERFTQYLWQHQYIPFQYGVHDCSLFVCGWVDKELGTGYLRLLSDMSRGTGLSKLIRRISVPGGYAALVNEVTGKIGALGEGKLGDVAVFRQPCGTETLGIQSHRLVHVPGKNGLTAFGSHLITHHWSLECLRP